MTRFKLAFFLAFAVPSLLRAGGPPDAVVLLRTSEGDVRLRLDAVHAPQTVANFLQYVREGFYNGVVFDRIEPGFVAEAGGRLADGSQKPTHPPVVNEASNGLKNTAGTVGLAREADPDSGSDHFYINLKDSPHLDRTGDAPDEAGYTVFGSVSDGFDVVEKIGTRASNSVTILAATVEKDIDPKTFVSADEKTFEALSQIYTIDKLYRSMTGPESTEPLTLEAGTPELLWITGYQADVIGDSGDPTGLAQYMCHSNLDLDTGQYSQLLKTDHPVNPRLFTLSQGQMDIEFPAGYGIPILSNQSLSLTTQVLNLNYDDCDLKVRHRTRIRFVRDRDMPFTMQPLFQVAVYGLKLLEGVDGRYGVDPAAHSGHDMASCLPGANAAAYEYKDGFNRTFTGHWVVRPGRETNHTPVDAMMNLPYDTRIHFIAVHLHPFSESIELYDDTAGKSVWKSHAENTPGRIGLLRVDTLESEDGIPLYHDHHYEVISTYNNTSTQDQDSMAVMFLYVSDTHFQKPSPTEILATAAPPPAEQAR